MHRPCLTRGGNDSSYQGNTATVGEEVSLFAMVYVVLLLVVAALLVKSAALTSDSRPHGVEEV